MLLFEPFYSTNFTMKFLILTVCSLLSISLSAQTIQVIDDKGQPIENVVVVGDDYYSHTLADGTVVHFPDKGIKQLAFLHPNYKRLTLNWDELVQLNFKITLEQRIRELNEVTIRPLKRVQLVEDAPQKVVALTPKDFQLQQPQTTADLLGSSNEVFIQKSQLGGGSPMIRGFSANRVLLVVDGVRMNNAIYRSGNLQNVIMLDAASLEQTEVILGPGSVIYGSDALGGVIHFYTDKPRLTTSGVKVPLRAMVRTSSANFEKTGHVNFNLSGEKWASLSSITFSDFDDLRMGSRQHPEYVRPHYVLTENEKDQMVVNSNLNRQVYSGYSQFNLIQKIRFRPSEQADLEYAFHFSNSSIIPRYDRLIQFSGENLKYAEWYYGPQKWIMHSLKSEFQLQNKLVNKLTVLGAYQDYTESRFDRKFGKTALRGRTEHLNIYSLNIDADKYFSKTQSLYFGAEGIYNKIHSTGIETDIRDQSETPIASRYPDGSNWWSMAVYALYHQMLNFETSLEAGVRYNVTGMSGTFDKTYYNFPFDDFNDSNGALSVNFGMVFNPTNNDQIKLNLASGFRAPNIDDAAKVFDSEPGSVIVPNPDLEPEYASSIDMGYRWNGEKLFLETTVFYTRLYNAMVRRDGQLNGRDSILYDGEQSKVKMITNADWANIGGVSAQINYKINPYLNVKAGINKQVGKDSDDLPVRHVAPLFGNGHLTFQKNKLLIDAYALFNGAIPYEKLALDEREKTDMYASDANGHPYSPAWWTLNLKALYRLSEKVALNLGLENILDIRYRPYSSGIVAPGLNVIFSVEIKI